MFLWGTTDLPVVIRWSLLNKESWRPSKNISLTKRKYFLGCSVVWNSVPGLYWSLFSLLRRFWALFLEFFGLRWALHSRSFVRRPLVPRFYKVLTMALPRDTSSSSVSVLGTTIGNHIKPLASLVLVVVSELFGPWEYFLDRQRLNSGYGNSRQQDVPIMYGMTNISSHVDPKGS